jgi:hypothetical protein
MTRILIYIVVFGFVVFWWLKRPRRVIELLPKDMDPKAPEARAFWYRSPQNKKRLGMGCSIYLMLASLVMGVYWFNTTYTVQRASHQAAIMNALSVADKHSLPTPTLEIMETPTP